MISFWSCAGLEVWFQRLECQCGQKILGIIKFEVHRKFTLEVLKTTPLIFQSFLTLIIKPYHLSLKVDLKYVYRKFGVVHSGNNVQ